MIMEPPFSLTSKFSLQADSCSNELNATASAAGSGMRTLSNTLVVDGNIETILSATGNWAICVDIYGFEYAVYQRIQSLRHSYIQRFQDDIHFFAKVLEFTPRIAVELKHILGNDLDRFPNQPSQSSSLAIDHIISQRGAQSFSGARVMGYFSSHMIV